MPHAWHCQRRGRRPAPGGWIADALLHNVPIATRSTGHKFGGCASLLRLALHVLLPHKVPNDGTEEHDGVEAHEPDIEPPQVERLILADLHRMASTRVPPHGVDDIARFDGRAARQLQLDTRQDAAQHASTINKVNQITEVKALLSLESLDDALHEANDHVKLCHHQYSEQCEHRRTQIWLLLLPAEIINKECALWEVGSAKVLRDPHDDADCQNGIRARGPQQTVATVDTRTQASSAKGSGLESGLRTVCEAAHCKGHRQGADDGQIRPRLAEGAEDRVLIGAHNVFNRRRR